VNPVRPRPRRTVGVFSSNPAKKRLRLYLIVCEMWQIQPHLAKQNLLLLYRLRECVGPTRLARPERDATDNVTLRTRDQARHCMAALPERRAMTSQWQIAAALLLDGADAETVTSALRPRCCSMAGWTSSWRGSNSGEAIHASDSRAPLNYPRNSPGGT
jgi:hypothetical protein